MIIHKGMASLNKNPLQAWIGPFGLQKVEDGTISKLSAHGVDKVVSPTHQSHFPVAAGS
jgi:hypothetical protein